MVGLHALVLWCLSSSTRHGFAFAMRDTSYWTALPSGPRLERKAMSEYYRHTEGILEDGIVAGIWFAKPRPGQASLKHTANNLVDICEPSDRLA